MSENDQIRVLKSALVVYRDFAARTAEHWDKDEDSKVGKRLLAMSGDLPGYATELDAIHRLIDGTEKPLP